MVHTCFLKICKSAQSRKSNCKFHGFPNDEKIRQLWIEKLGQKPKMHSKVCSLHFKKSDYNKTNALRPGLKVTAVPSRNLPNTEKKDRFDSDYEEESDDTMSFASHSSAEDDNVEEMKPIMHKYICRTCLRQGDEDFESLTEKNLNIYFTDLTRIKLDEDDTGSKMVCNKCSVLLTTCNTFKETCLKSDQFFKKNQVLKEEKIAIKKEINQQRVTILPENINEFVACDYGIPPVETPAIILKNESMVPVEVAWPTLANEQAIDPVSVKREHTKKKSKPTEKNEEKKVKFKQMLEDNGFVQCPYCPKKFVKINTFYKHKRDHFQTYMCAHCGKQYSSQRSLTIHYSFMHTSERKFKCDMCGAAFKAKASLIDHMDTRHGNSRNFVCDRCSSAFKSKKSLGSHIRLVHSNLEAKFECDKCGRKFKKRSYLITHAQLHTGHKLYTCEICFKSFTTKKSRDRHQERHQTTESRPFQCHLCFQVFKKDKYHRRHMRNYHPEEANAKALRMISLVEVVNNESELNPITLIEGSSGQIKSGTTIS